MEELRYQIDLLSAMNQKLSNDEKMFRLICNTSSSAFIYYSFEDDSIRTIANWDYFFDISITKIRELNRLFDQEEDKYVLPLRDLFYLEKNGMSNDSVIVKLRNGIIWVECEATILYDDFGNPTDKIIRFKDITKLKSQNDELTYLAYYDISTGLYNRNYFVRLLGDFVRKAQDENAVVSVMFIDIDDFRKINDGMGMIIGDEMVQQFGQFLSEFKSEQIIVSHFNADIYCIAVYDPCGIQCAETIYEKIITRIKKPFRLSNGMELNITVSVGVAEYPEAAHSALELINCAEIVMFKTKATGKNSIQYFDAPILHDFLQNVTIENKLKEAVFSQNFMMFFQPQYYINAKCDMNDKVCAAHTLRGVEALIRWRDYDGKMISPTTFIPIAEKNGTIVPMGNWVIEESIKIYAEWRRIYHYPMILSLNISAIQYKQDDFIKSIIDILSKYHVEPSELELEITESILIDDFREITEKLHILREYGIRISLDDFGTGYSSLSYLKGLPIDTLKIDKSFIDTIITDENTRIITESIIYMVKKLGFETVAEGVETKKQYEYLQSIGCECIQGYLLGKPMPAKDIEDVLKRTR